MNDLTNISDANHHEFIQDNVMPLPGYYRIKKDHESDYYRDKGFVANELVYVIPGVTSVNVLVGSMTWTYEEHEMGEFYDHFEYDPNGAAERQAEVAKLMQEVITEGCNNSISNQLLEFNPHIEDDGDESNSTGLMTVGGKFSMAEAKRNIAETRNTVLKTQRDLRLKTKRLEALLSEQSRALEVKAKQLEGMMKKAEEAIWSINLYLGKNEEIHKLIEGEPAPATEKIAIRQSVLFMDEECAMLARGGGIDASSIEKFDEWITSDKSHIQQIIPESKGIVALHIRRHRKEYQDPWTNAQLNDANIHWTYFLIRNGENLYRVFVDIVIGSNLFPTEHEYNELFMTTEIDYDTPGHPRTQTFLKPGSDKYMKAMEKADAKHRHYLRVVLILQGLLDRTTIFKPMPVERINICNLNACEEYLHLIYDKENVIGDGRPTFCEWQQTINSQLEVGHRIIGVFDYASRLKPTKRDGYEESRIYPSTARYPNSLQLHTIEKRSKGQEGNGFIILYERTGDVIYPRNWYDESHAAEVRARCLLYHTDGFILNFDAATLEDMEYYLNSRKSRQAYQNMVPVLEIAIQLKKAEIAEEAPFRLLLIGNVMKSYKVSRDEAESRIDELIKWWKFKNRNHRALTSEDTKALKMIVSEFGHRLKQESVRNRTATFNDIIVNSILANGQDVIMIAHKSGNKYTAYVAHNEHNIWVREQVWSHNRVTGEVTLSEDKEWKLVDKRYIRWDIIYKTDRWDSWRINPQMSQVLTDPELSAGVQKLVDHLTKTDEDDEDIDQSERFLPLCAYYDKSFKIYMWYSSRGPIIPKELVMSSHNDSPKVCRIEAVFERKKDGVSFRVTYPSIYSYRRSSDLPWPINDKDSSDSKNLITMWSENVKLIKEEFAQYEALGKEIDQLEDKYDYVIDAVAQRMYDEQVAAARKEFDSEHGDPELWDDHLASLKIKKQQYHHLLKEALNLLAERHIDIVGWTIEQVFQKAIEFGLFNNDSDSRYRVRRFAHLSNTDNAIPQDMPLELVVPEPPLKTDGKDDN